MTSDSGISGRQYMTLVALASFADDLTGMCWPGLKAISFRARQSRSTTLRALDELASSGWLQIGKNQGPHGVNLYQLNLEKLQAHSRNPQLRKKLWKSSAKAVDQEREKGPKPRQVVSSFDTRIVIEELGKRKVQEKTELLLAADVSPGVLPVTLFLKKLNQQIEQNRRRGHPESALEGIYRRGA